MKRRRIWPVLIGCLPLMPLGTPAAAQVHSCSAELLGGGRFVPADEVVSTGNPTNEIGTAGIAVARIGCPAGPVTAGLDLRASFGGYLDILEAGAMVRVPLFGGATEGSRYPNVRLAASPVLGWGFSKQSAGDYRLIGPRSVTAFYAENSGPAFGGAADLMFALNAKLLALVSAGWHGLWFKTATYNSQGDVVSEQRELLQFWPVALGIHVRLF